MELLVKKSIFVVSLAAVLCLVAGALSAQSLKVLTIGNSFANSVFVCLPEIVKSVPGCELVLDRANIGGCSLERHWNELKKSEADPAYKPYDDKYTLKDKLTSQPWDIITMQQVSTLSFKPESFEPWFKNLYDYVRQYAPQAEIVIQMTWSYRADHRFFTSVLPGGQNEMYEKLSLAYGQIAEKYQLRVIPTGYALQLARKNQPVQFVPGKIYNKEELSEFVYPKLPSEAAGSFITGPSWSKPNPKDGHRVISYDLIHFNRRGQYLQGCLWFAELFQQPTDKITYAPKELSAADAAFLRQMAQKARDEYPQPAAKK